MEWIINVVSGGTLYGPWPSYKECALDCDGDPNTHCESELECWDIYTCILESSESSEWVDCYLTGTKDGQHYYDEMSYCAAQNCMESETLTDYISCINVTCIEEAEGCFEQGCFEEICDGIDNDCDGVVDNGFDVGASCQLGEGSCAQEGVLSCAPNGQELLCDALAGKEQGSPCDDLNFCTTDDQCSGGVTSTCTGISVDCDDGDPCTLDLCEPGLGCVSEEILGCDLAIESATSFEGKGGESVEGVS